jgi:hypothetical protein
MMLWRALMLPCYILIADINHYTVFVCPGLRRPESPLFHGSRLVCFLAPSRPSFFFRQSLSRRLHRAFRMDASTARGPTSAEAEPDSSVACASISYIIQHHPGRRFHPYLLGYGILYTAVRRHETMKAECSQSPPSCAGWPV